MKDTKDIWQGTLALMVLKTLDVMGPQHGYGVARRIERIRGDRLLGDYWTLSAALVEIDQEGYISAQCGVSDSNRRAKYYSLTPAGRKQLRNEAQQWEQAAGIMVRFLS